jgi:hypothetical protein
MTECGRSSVIAHPASGSFCSTQVNLTVPRRGIVAGALVAHGKLLMVHCNRFRCPWARLQKPPRLLDLGVLPTQLGQVYR